MNTKVSPLKMFFHTKFRAEYRIQVAFIANLLKIKPYKFKRKPLEKVNFKGTD